MTLTAPRRCSWPARHTALLSHQTQDVCVNRGGQHTETFWILQSPTDVVVALFHRTCRTSFSVWDKDKKKSPEWFLIFSLITTVHPLGHLRCTLFHFHSAIYNHVFKPPIYTSTWPEVVLQDLIYNLLLKHKCTHEDETRRCNPSEVWWGSISTACGGNQTCRVIYALQLSGA